jgi:hypothetical protein
VQAGTLQAAGDGGGEESCDALLAFFGLAAERQLAVDDGAAEGSLGVVAQQICRRAKGR